MLQFLFKISWDIWDNAGLRDADASFHFLETMNSLGPRDAYASEKECSLNSSFKCIENNADN